MPLRAFIAYDALRHASIDIRLNDRLLLRARYCALAPRHAAVAARRFLRVHEAHRAAQRRCCACVAQRGAARCLLSLRHYYYALIMMLPPPPTLRKQLRQIRTPCYVSMLIRRYVSTLYAAAHYTLTMLCYAMPLLSRHAAIFHLFFFFFFFVDDMMLYAMMSLFAMFIFRLMF